MKLIRIKYHICQQFWDCTAIWHNLHNARTQLEKSLKALAEFEEVSTDSDPLESRLTSDDDLIALLS